MISRFCIHLSKSLLLKCMAPPSGLYKKQQISNNDNHRCHTDTQSAHTFDLRITVNMQRSMLANVAGFHLPVCSCVLADLALVSDDLD